MPNGTLQTSKSSSWKFFTENLRGCAGLNCNKLLYVPSLSTKLQSTKTPSPTRRKSILSESRYLNRWYFQSSRLFAASALFLSAPVFGFTHDQIFVKFLRASADRNPLLTIPPIGLCSPTGFALSMFAILVYANSSCHSMVYESFLISGDVWFSYLLVIKSVLPDFIRWGGIFNHFRMTKCVESWKWPISG